MHDLRNNRKTDLVSALLFGLWIAFGFDLGVGFIVWMLSILQHWVVYAVWGPVLAAVLFWASLEDREPSLGRRLCGSLLVSGVHLITVAALWYAITYHGS